MNDTQQKGQLAEESSSCDAGIVTKSSDSKVGGGFMSNAT